MATKRKKGKRKTAKRGGAKRKKAGKKRKPNAAFMKPMRPDAAGIKPMPRTQITKKLWQYIKRHKLQDKKNRRMINADAKMGKVFNGKKQVSMFEMTKLASRHMK
jgi:upstream activation factor subunit UAF30